MEFGFSIVGVIFLVMLFAPNILWAKRPPIGYKELARRENKVLLILERIGEVACSVCAVIFVSPEGISFPWALWVCIAFALMVVYEFAWMRYFRGGRKLEDMYMPFGFIPMPLATLPVIAFLLLGIWYKSLIAILAAIVLGIGHIGIHYGHLQVVLTWKRRQGR